MSHDQQIYAEAASGQLAAGQGTTQRLAAWQAVVTLAEEDLQQRAIDPSHIACGPGCGSCCVVNVNILEPEALAIAAYVASHFPENERQRLQVRLEHLHRATRWLDDEERMMARKACAFLDTEQSCSIHPVRPLLCRSLSSTDPGQCHEAIAMLALGEAPQIVCSLAQRSLYHQAYLGFATALERWGADNRSHRLAGLLSQYLNTEKGRP